VLVAGLVLGVVSIVTAVGGAISVSGAISRPIIETVGDPVRTTPVDTTLELAAGNWTVVQYLDAADQRIMVGAVRFSVPRAGRYRVRVASPGARPVDLAIAPPMAAGLSRPASWFVVTVLGAVGFVVAVVLVGVGLALRRRRRPEMGSGSAAAALAGAGGGAGAGPNGAGPNRAGLTGVGPNSATAPAALPPGGWYPAPDLPGRMRYWDGARWTEHLR
jgi:hypothetical protein